MNNILILTTYQDFLTTSLVNQNKKTGSILLPQLSDLFHAKGYKVEILTFEKVKNYNDYKGWFVLYASSEDAGLFYKDYIEDVLLSLKLAKAILLPDFIYFRAHHNKSFMEMLRSSFDDESLKTIKSSAFWCYDCMQTEAKHFHYPLIVKASAGSGSKGVMLVSNESQLNKCIKKVSKRLFWDYDIKHNYALIEWIKNVYRRMQGQYPVSYLPHAQKFVIQNFISGMQNDYKVLIFGNKYYILQRLNRDNDFRASGSGKFIFPTELPQIQHILDFAKRVTLTIDAPIYSLDIGFDGECCHLIEFQCINFGPFTLQKSPCWFSFNQNAWHKHDGTSILEEEYVQAICECIEKHTMKEVEQ